MRWEAVCSIQAPGASACRQRCQRSQWSASRRLFSRLAKNSLENMNQEMPPARPTPETSVEAGYLAPPRVPDHELLRRIGGGSYGEVWLARSVTGAYRAVKVVYRRTFDHDRPYEREFHGLRKYEPISRSHASQVNILHVGRSDGEGYFYYVLELADDARSQTDSGLSSSPEGNPAQPAGAPVDVEHYVPRTLQDDLRQRGRLPFAECLRIGLSLTTALEHLHRHGLVHRDIKPSNIIFIQGVPKLADIGLVTGMEASQSIVGTEGYLPPEGPGTPQADLYSLGKVLYEISLGRDRKEFPELPTALREFPDRQEVLELNEIVLRACHADARSRYQTATEMHADLVLLSSGKSVVRLRLLERHLRHLKKAALAMGGLAVLGAAVFYQAQRSHQKDVRALERMNVGYGEQRLKEQDFGSAALYYAEALRLSAKGSPAEYVHRVRLGSLLGQCPRPLQLLVHQGPVNDARFSPDGDRVVTASDDQTARVWDVFRGQPLTPPLRHQREVNSACFSPDGTKVVTWSEDQTARLWDAQSGLPIGAPFRHERGLILAEFSPDGRRVLTASVDQAVRLWDVESSRLVLPPLQTDGPLRHACFSPDGRQILTVGETGRAGGNQGAASLWDTATGQPRRLAFGHSAAIAYARFRADGQQIVTTSRDQTARLWDVRTAEPITPPLVHGAPVHYAAFDPSRTRVVTIAEDYSVRIWNATNGQPVTAPIKHQGQVRCAAFSADGKLLATGCIDQSARVWDAATGVAVTPLLRHNSWVRRVSFSADGRWLLTAGGDALARIWDLQLRKIDCVVLPHPQAVQQARFSPDGTKVITSTLSRGKKGEACLWEARTGRRMIPTFVHKDRILQISFSPDGQRIATTSLDRTARVWDVATGEPITPSLPHASPVWTAMFSPDGQQILTASGENGPGEARIWSVSTGRPVTPAMRHDFDVMWAAFSPRGDKVVTAGGAYNGPGEGRLWSAADGHPLTPAFKHNGPVWFVVFSADGRQVATASADQTARIWDAATGNPLTPPLRHGGVVFRARFSPDGRWLVTASADQTARVWSTTTGDPVTGALKHDGVVIDANFDPVGRLVITASADGTARLWNAVTGDSVTPPCKHGGAVLSAIFSNSGREFLTASEDGTAKVWQLPFEANTPEDLVKLAQLLSGGQIHAQGGFLPLKPTELKSRLDDLRRRHPADFPLPRVPKIGGSDR